MDSAQNLFLECFSIVLVRTSSKFLARVRQPTGSSKWRAGFHLKVRRWNSATFGFLGGRDASIGVKVGPNAIERELADQTYAFTIR